MNSRNEKIQEITEALHAGIQDLFQSERYKEYLKVMSRFSHYSANNCLLISMQRPDTYAVAGYKSWQTKFGRQVQKGATAITIIQPAPWKTKGTVTLTDEDGKAIIGADGQEVTAVVEKIIPSFKLGHVFAYEDTDGKPLPEIASILQGEVQDYENIMGILCTVSPVPIQFEEFPGAANGYFHLVDNKIVVKSSLPELQKLKTTIHEIAHSILHKKDTGEDLNANQREREVEAESVAFTVCSYLGLDTSEYSFGYIGGWSKSWELKELQEKMEVIRKAANQIISGIERERLKQTMQNCAELSCKSGNGYFHIAKAEDGCYDYTLYNLGFQVVDGGRWENGEIPIDEAARRILTCHNQHAEFFTLCDTDFLLEAAEKAAAEKSEIQKNAPYAESEVKTVSESRTLEERVSEKEAQLKRAIEKAEQYKAQLRQLQTRKASEDRKRRTHQLILCGAELAALYGKPLDTEEIHAVVDFLRRQKATGAFTIGDMEPPATEAAQRPEKETEESGYGLDMFNF